VAEVSESGTGEGGVPHDGPLDGLH
jgi:hypothetical protein